MHADFRAPWFESAVARLDVQKGIRLLALMPGIDEARALCGALGKAGQLTTVMTDHHLAESLAKRDWPGLEVVLHEVRGGERFGTFDAMLVAAPTGPLLPCSAYAELARVNLRPGGRFVIDVPAPDMLPDLRSAWTQLGRDEEQLRPLTGPDDIELATALRAAGLRSVAAALGSHLVHVPSATELACAFAEPLGLGDDDCTEVGHAIVSLRQDAGPLDVLVHRTRVSGQR